jgi:two-component system sensor histidine kinase/response regulator
VQTDERKLREVLINLLGNAIKFTQQGRVTLRVSIENGGKEDKEDFSENASLSSYSLFFEVEDTGAGIAPEELDELFTAFGQTETGRKSGEGTGLGLPISQKFVQLMGGTITVSSNPAQGTTFAFDVQVKLAQAADISKTHQTSRVIGLAPDQPNYRILVVEDRLESRLLLVKLLTSLGFSVREAENGQEALELWSSYSPHLILMDMRMPVMDGYEATTQIRSHLKGQTTVIIALTASVFEEERNIVLSAGCDDFVHKPFREEVLLEKMAEHLGVRYLYEEVKSPDVVSGDGAFEETQGEFMITDQSLSLHLSQMPTEWIEQLHQAANKCFDHVIIQLIKEIPQAHAPLAIALENWANNFLFEQVIDLIQEVQVKEPLFALKN